MTECKDGALTDEDRAEIEEISARRGRPPASRGGIREEIYLAGKRAGLRAAAPTGAPAVEDVELCKRLREAKASLQAHGVTIKEWDGSLYLKAAARIEALAERIARQSILLNESVKATARAEARIEALSAQVAELDATMVRHSGHASGLIDAAVSRAERAEAALREITTMTNGNDMVLVARRALAGIDDAIKGAP